MSWPVLLQAFEGERSLLNRMHSTFMAARIRISANVSARQVSLAMRNIIEFLSLHCLILLNLLAGFAIRNSLGCFRPCISSAVRKLLAHNGRPDKPQASSPAKCRGISRLHDSFERD